VTQPHKMVATMCVVTTVQIVKHEQGFSV